MYNRYVRNDNGQYERIPVDHMPPPFHPDRHNIKEEFSYIPDEPPHTEPLREEREKKKGTLSSLLRKLNMDGIDTGDLLLLTILFLLFKDGDDEELLFALGLLLLL